LPLAYLVPGMDHWRIFADESTASLFSMSGRIFSYVQPFTRLNATEKLVLPGLHFISFIHIP
jgi:hypothetical protein